MMLHRFFTLLFSVHRLVYPFFIHFSLFLFFFLFIFSVHFFSYFISACNFAGFFREVFMRYYSVFDLKESLYHPPFTASSDSDALRRAAFMKADNKSLLHLFPEDYELHLVGSFDEKRGLDKDKQALGSFLDLPVPMSLNKEASDVKPS